MGMFLACSGVSRLCDLFWAFWGYTSEKSTAILVQLAVRIIFVDLGLINPANSHVREGLPGRFSPYGQVGILFLYTSLAQNLCIQYTKGWRTEDPTTRCAQLWDADVWKIWKSFTRCPLSPKQSTPAAIIQEMAVYPMPGEKWWPWRYPILQVAPTFILHLSAVPFVMRLWPDCGADTSPVPCLFIKLRKRNLVSLLKKIAMDTGSDGVVRVKPRISVGRSFRKMDTVSNFTYWWIFRDKSLQREVRPYIICPLIVGFTSSRVFVKNRRTTGHR